MKPIKALDLSIACTGVALAVLSGVYVDNTAYRNGMVAVGLLAAAGFLYLALKSPEKKGPPPSETYELVLLSEEDSELARWDLYGKTSLVIGRDIRENHVDVNLSQAVYASMIDIEHAVLNYSAGAWCVEDLESHNGVSVQKSQDGRKYRLAPGQPCRLAKHDIVYVGLTRLLIR